MEFVSILLLRLEFVIRVCNMFLFQRTGRYVGETDVLSAVEVFLSYSGFGKYTGHFQVCLKSGPPVMTEYPPSSICSGFRTDLAASLTTRKDAFVFHMRAKAGKPSPTVLHLSTCSEVIAFFLPG